MELRLFCADVTELEDPELFRRLYRAVSASRRAKVDRIRSEAGRLQSLGAGALLEASLAELGVAAPQPEEDAYGKPFLPGCERLCFNLSHSGTQVLCALSDRDVGCDVERIHTARLRLAARCFCPEEYEALLACDDETARDALFYRIWTLKESFVKAVGRGLSLPMNAFCILPGEAGIELRQSADTRRYELRAFCAEGYQYAFCSVERSLDGVWLEARSLRALAELLPERE